jgi:hypothetical protein
MSHRRCCYVSSGTLDAPSLVPDLRRPDLGLLGLECLAMALTSAAAT